MPRVIEESWEITSGLTANITYADGVASKWSDIWKYQVPTGEAHLFKPGHHFSIYLDEGTGSTEAGAGDARIRIEIRDQSEQDSKSIYGPALYAACKDFDDVTKMATLDLQHDISVEEKFWVVVLIYNDAIVTYDYSYFSLETVRVRSGV